MTDYTPPRIQIIVLQHDIPVLWTSPKNAGSGNLPPTDNDNNDNDW